MAYIDGFVYSVPAADKQVFIDFVHKFDPLMLEFGATRVVECWGDDVPHGKQTDFYRAVDAKENEVTCFAWIEWPDKATRDAAMATMTEWMNDPAKADPRMDPEKNPMPFDGKRLIFGGFTPVLDLKK
jgi:uncharacterized protein YbaA (DUF1428 family)